MPGSSCGHTLTAISVTAPRAPQRRRRDTLESILWCSTRRRHGFYMFRKIMSRVFLCAAFVVSFFCVAPVLQSCSDGPEPFSDYSSHPDVPLAKFAAGRLGIVQPAFARSYLVVAYRYASGVPLSKDEQFGVFAVWNNRIGEYPIYSTPGEQTSGPPNPYLESISTEAATKIWSDARAPVVSTPAPQINPFQ